METLTRARRAGRRFAACILAAVAVMCAMAELPDSFVEYVESTGTQYIDTGIVGKTGTKVEMDVNYISGIVLLGAQASSDVGGLITFAQDYGNCFGAILANNGHYANAAYKLNSGRHILQTEATAAGSLTMNVDWEPNVTLHNYGSAYDSGQNLYLFCGNSGNSAGDPESAWYSKAKLYSLRIWQLPVDGATKYELVRDFLPCVKDGKAGLYDFVTGEIFYSKSGTDLQYGGTETAPSDMPDCFTEYIYSTGSQYFDTGITGRSGTVAEVDTIFQGGVCLLGATAADNKSIAFGFNYGGNISVLNNDQPQHSGIGLSATERRVFRSVVDLNGYITISVNSGAFAALKKTQRFTAERSLYLLNTNTDNDTIREAWYCRARLYGTKIWQTASIDSAEGGFPLVRYFRPCYKGNRACLFDMVSRTIFYPNGGEVYCGAVSVAEEPDVFLESVGSNDNSQFLDTGVLGRFGSKFLYRGLIGNTGDPAKIAVLGSLASGGNWFLPLQFLGSGWGAQAANVVSESIGVCTSESTVLSEFTTAGDFTLTVDSESSATQTVSLDAASDAGVNSIYLFAANNYANPGLVGITATCKSLSIWQTATYNSDASGYRLVRDFYPCVKNNKAGLYDFVTKRIYYPPSESGALVAGNVITPFIVHGTNGEVNYTIPYGRTFYVCSTTVGDNYTTAGTVTLGDGSKIQFDSANCGTGGMSFTAEGGFAVPAGDILDYVELTDATAYSATLENNGKTIVVRKLANVASVAYWTGGGAAGDMADPANWKCVNSAGDVIENGIPVVSTAVWAREGDGATSFAIPEGYTPNWASFNVGGNVSLSSACDWSVFPVVKFTSGATLDLNGNNLKVTRIEVASGTASVVNTAAGTKPSLWRENATHESYLVGSGVTIDTATVEVKVVNSVDHTFVNNIAGTCDATFVQNGGDATSTKEFSIGYSNHYGIYEMNGGTFTAKNSLIPGGVYNGSGELRQSGGTVNANSYFVIGYLGGEGIYRITGGTLNIPKQPAWIGSGGSVGTLDIAGGTVVVARQTCVGLDANGNGTLRMRGGTLTTQCIEPSGGAENTVEFDGGTVKANSLSGNEPFLNNLTNIVFGAGGVTIDADGHDLTVSNCTFKAEAGRKAITFANGGTLTFADTTLELTGTTSGSYVFAEATGGGKFSGVPSMNLKNWSVKLSKEGDKVIIDRNGLVIFVR